MVDINKFKIKLFADGANIEDIKNLNSNPLIKGFTTNPTLMKKSGITDYEKFSREVIDIVNPKSISLEVFADEIEEMEMQARKIAQWGNNVYVKIPIQNTKGISTSDLVSKLSKDGIKINVTAIFTLDQINDLFKKVDKKTEIIFSIFAGRIADAGIDPEEIIKKSVEICKDYKNIEILWASPREVFNIVQAEKCGVHILTATKDILNKTKSFGKNLDKFSLETVEMFYNDAKESKFQI